MPWIKVGLGHKISLVIYICLLANFVSNKGVNCEDNNWYKGCFNVSCWQDATSLNNTPAEPVQCAHACLLQGFNYASVSDDVECWCKDDVNSTCALQPDLCKTRCGRRGWLPCGTGEDTIAVYHSAGPYLSNVSVRTDNKVYVGQRTAFEVRAHFAADPNITILGVSPPEQDVSTHDVTFLWRHVTGDYTQEIVTDAINVQATWLHRFSTPGIHVVDISVSNLLSIKTVSVKVEVVLPIPTSLQLALLTPEEQLPSCVPRNYSVTGGTKTTVVFIDLPVALEAAVNVGNNLTFLWTVTDQLTGDSEIIEEEEFCEGRNCTLSRKTHVFTRPGWHTIHVNASNHLGQVQDSMDLIVVGQEIRDVNFSLHEQTPFVISPLQEVTFAVTLVTASRRDAFLSAHFGDSDQVYSVREKNATLLRAAQDAVASDILYLTGSYGSGCDLQLELRHVYKQQGVYQPWVEVYNNHSQLTVHADNAITVQNKLFKPAIFGPRIAAVDEEMVFTVTFSTRSDNISYTWCMIATSGMVPLVNVTNFDSQFSYTFQEAGLYSLQVFAVNLISSVSTEMSLQIEEPIDGVDIVARQDHYVRVGERVTFEATVERGTHVEFEWNLQDPRNEETQVLYTNASSVISHTFLRAGVYNVTVRVFNSLGSNTVYLPDAAVVQEPVANLVVRTMGPSMAGSNTTFVAMVLRGCHVLFDFDYKYGRVPVGNESVGSLVEVYAEHSFATEGRHLVTVYAYNHVSNTSREVELIVQKAVPHFTMTTLSPSVITEYTVIVAKTNDGLNSRSDLVYVWWVDGKVHSRSQLPAMSIIFHVAGQHRVNLTVHNLVNEYSTSKIIQVHASSDQPRFNQSLVSALRQKTHFRLIHLTTGTVDIEVDYGDNNKATLADSTGKEKDWEYTYALPGIYQVSANCHDKTSSSSPVCVSSVVTVQEPVFGLAVDGPHFIPVLSFAKQYTWRAKVTAGSHVLYNWTIGNQVLITSTETLTKQLTKAGTYELSVLAFNGVSRETRTHSIIVEHEISQVDLMIAPVIQGQVSRINVTVHGSLEFELDVDFGDGNRTQYSSRKDEIRRLRVTSGSEAADGIPVYKCIINYQYAQQNIYTVHVNVSNKVSWLEQSKNVVVDEPIDGVVVTSDSPPVLAIGKFVAVRATVASGKDLTFDWDFSDVILPTVVSTGNSSIARHMFSDTNSYEVRVLVSNPLYNQPIEAKLPFKFVVVRPITNLMLSPVDGATTAKLQRRPSGHDSTDLVYFEARATGASDVTFTFDMGDGQTIATPGEREFFGDVVARASHTFTAVGEYWVTVRAVNQLDNVTASLGRPFIVEYAPEGLRLDRAVYYTKFGNVTVMNVSTTSGTTLSYDWDMGDQSEYIDAGPSVAHRYMQVGKFTVTIRAFNRVAYQEIKADVSVQEILLGLNITVDKLIHQTGSELTFEATPYPDLPFIATYYEWDFGEPDIEPKITYNKRQTHKYFTHGMYTVGVKAFNNFSHVSAEKLVVVAVNPISEVTLSYEGQSVVGHNITFMANHYKGTQVLYHWDFGDGTTKDTRYLVATHNYTNVGQFNITVAATNYLGSQVGRIKIFVLEKICRPPDVTILGTKGRQAIRSEDLKIEASVKINCSITVATIYTWTIKNGTSQESLAPQLVEQHVLHDPTLYIPRHSLPYGNYSVQLKIEMNGTIVFAEAEAYFLIVPTPLMSIISGGIQRYGSNHDTIIMDGSLSYDPDFPQADNFSYKWSCYQLYAPEVGCFVDNDTLLDDVSVMNVSGQLFISDLNFPVFVFNLTVSRIDRISSYSTQVVELQRNSVISVRVVCDQCEKVLINPDEKLVLKALHPGLLEEELEYEWTLYHVPDGNSLSPAGVHDYGTCVQTDGSSYWNYLFPNSTDNTLAQDESSSLSPVEDQSTTTERGTTLGSTPSSTPSTTTTTMPGGGGMGINPAEADPLGGPRSGLPFPIGEGSAGPEGNIRSPFRPPPIEPVEGDLPPVHGLNPSEGNMNPVEGERDSFNPVEGGSAGRRSQPSQEESSSDTQFNPQEGTGGRGSGRSEPSGKSDGSPRDQKPGDGGRGGKACTSCGKINPVVDATRLYRTDPHVVNMIRYPILLHPHQTTTGLHQRALVIKPSVLRQARTYIVELKVWHRGLKRQGTALTYLKVNESPSLGRCTISPDPQDGPGIEMETQFRIFCLEWKDEHHPIRYEVSYSLQANQPPDLLYQGLNHLVTFQLPAGQAANNYQVEVHISILDSLNARTSVCSIPFTVKPKQLDSADQTEEQILYGLVKEETSPLQEYVYKGDNRNARLYAQMVANRLNRLHSIKQTNGRVWRQRARKVMLDTLNQLPMRDAYEIQQTTSAVAFSTAVAEELTEESLWHASAILEKAGDQIYALSSSNGLERTVSESAIAGTSNVLEATSRIEDQQADWQTKEIVSKSAKAIQTILKAEMAKFTIGEEPLEMTAQSIYAYANRYKFSSAPSIPSEGAVFVLPKNLPSVLPTNLTTPSPAIAETVEANDCYQAHLVSYKNNPYNFGIDKGEKVQTKVSSLTLYSCEGQELEVHNLAEANQLLVEIPHAVVQENGEDSYALHKHQMNIHSFNLSFENQKQALYIDIKLKPVRTGRLFPISVLLRADSPPDPYNYLKKWDFSARKNSLSVFLHPGLLKASSSYYVGIVDSTYNSGRPRRGEVRRRDYKLKLWWGECLYWDEQQDTWSPDGCYIDQSSTYYKARCRCSHLTNFGAHFSVTPNRLDFTNVEDFFDLYENPVTFCLVASLLVFYVILIIVCVRLDRHDDKKCALVHLVDNNPSHQQKYIIAMETGFRKAAGTTAKVSMVLHGEEGMSETRELVSQLGQPLFERNSRDTFLMTLPDNLGKLFKIQLWHNNAGLSPSWYLSRVTVTDLNTGRPYYFNCEKWFAVEEEDGKVEREIMVLEGGLGFPRVLWCKATQYFIDYHLWFSTLTRPSYSRFTRAQRLTCCLCLLMSYMAVNAVWYQGRRHEYRGEVGLIDVSWRSVAVGAITSLLVFPVNFIIILLFRRSKIRRITYELVPNRKFPNVKRNSISSIESTARLLQPVLTPSIFDQSILHWQNLQEWAQKMWAKQYQQSPASSTQSVRHVHHDDTPDNTISPDIQVVPPATTHELNDTHNESRDSNSSNLPTVNTQEQAFAQNIQTGEQSETDSSFHSSLADGGRLGHPPSEHTEDGTSSQSTTQNDAVSDEDNIHHGVEMEKPDRRTFNNTPPSSESCTSGFQPGHYRPTFANTGHQNSPASSTKSFYLGKQAMDNQKKAETQKFTDHDGPLSSGKPKRIFLPECSRILAWCLCGVIICGCAVVTIMYGFRFGRVKSIMWLQSLFFSFIQCAFLTHPVMILLVAIAIGIKYRNDMSVFDHYDDGIIEVKVKQSVDYGDLEPDKENSFQLAEGIAMRQRSRYLRFARPPQEKHLIESRNKTIKEKKATSCFSEATVFVFLFGLLAFMAFGKDVYGPFHMNSSLRNMFVRSGHLSLDHVKSVPEWWMWAKSDFVSLAFSDAPDRSLASHLATIGNSILIGQINLRQLRVDDKPCAKTLPYQASGSCRFDNGQIHTHTAVSAVNDSWQSDMSAEDSRTQDDVDGFIILLSKNRQEAVGQLEALEKQDWLDKYTRTVVMEFTLFHPPTSLFSSVKLLIEKPATGAVITRNKISSVHLYKYMSSLDKFVLACEIFFMIAILLKVRHVLIDIARLRGDFLKDPWNTVEVTLCALSMAFIGCYVYRFVLVADTVEELRATYHERYVDVSSVAFWDQVLRALVGFMFFLLVLLALKLLRHRPIFASFGNVFKQGALDLVVCGAMFVIWVCAYTSLGIAMFGAISHSFHSLDMGILRVTGLFTGHYVFHDIISTDYATSLGWRLFVVSFLCFALGSLTAYVIAVLNYHYRTSKRKDSLVFNNVQTVRYLANKLTVLLRLSKQEVPRQNDVILPPEFTMAEIEYQVDEMLFKMNALARTSNLPEKPPQYFTDSDTTYGMADDALSSGSEVRNYDDDKIESRIHKIEDNLFGNEPHLAQLIQLESIGADVMVQEKEKRLRSHLELEIFRQLQLERQEKRLPGAAGSDTYPNSSLGYPTPSTATLSYSSSSAAPNTSTGSGSDNSSPGGPRYSPRYSLGAKGRRFPFPKQARLNLGILHPPSEEAEETGNSAQVAAPDDSVNLDPMVLQNLSEGGSSSVDDCIPLKEFENNGVCGPDDTTTSNVARVDQSNPSAGSSSSGGVELRKYFTPGEDATKPNKSSAVGELRKTPSRFRSSSRDRVDDADEPGKSTKVLKSAASTRFRTKPKDIADCDDLLPKSTSDDDSIKAGKARALRKTKSRGKGKGRNALALSKTIDTLAYDNQAYCMDSDEECDLPD